MRSSYENTVLKQGSYAFKSVFNCECAGSQRCRRITYVTHGQGIILRNRFLDDPGSTLKGCTVLKSKQGQIQNPMELWNQGLPRSSCTTRAFVNKDLVETTISIYDSLVHKFSLFCRFCRFYAIWGTVALVLAMSILPLQSVSDLSLAYFMEILKALAAMMLINIFSIGINEVYDIEIDKINKPHLPLASGEISMLTGITIITGAASLSVFIGLVTKSPSLIGAILSFFFMGGVVYSVDLPLLRWKNNPILAVMSITINRAIGAQIGLFLHFQIYVLKKPIVFTKSLLFTIIFMCIYMPAIALLKDVPDEDGDRAHGVKSLVVKFGKEKVFKLVIQILMVLYGASMVVGASSPILLNKWVLVLGHSILAFTVLVHALSVNLSSKDSMTSFYLLVWKFVYVEYILIPFIC